MEKTYITGELRIVEKHRKMNGAHGIAFSFAAGPWRLPENTLAFMADVGGAWTGLEETEAAFFQFMANSVDSGIDFPTRLNIQLYATLGKKTDRINADLLVFVETGKVCLGLLVDETLAAETALDDTQLSGFRELISDMHAHFGGRHEHRAPAD